MRWMKIFVEKFKTGFNEISSGAKKKNIYIYITNNNIYTFIFN